MISVVIPTYNEASVIQETLRRAAKALKASGEEFELIVVDDGSPDGTAQLAERLSTELPVRVIQRGGRLGLATAVVDGWKSARGEVLGVMDADLQHPPEVLRELARALATPGVDLVAATRYAAGGRSSDWSLLRRIISWGATHLAGSVLPGKLGGISDPMSGMFMVRASAVADAPLDPVGYKIFLEVLAKAHYREVVEVPYAFEERVRGSSKLGVRQYFEFLAHLARLARSTGQRRAWFRYGTVGLIGAIVDVASFTYLVGLRGWRPALALPLALEAALLCNFLLNDRWTFSLTSSRNKRGSFVARLARYEKVCTPGALINLALTLFAVRRGVLLVFAAVFGVVAGGLWNFLLRIPSIWRVWVSSPLLAPLPAAPAEPPPKTA